ncbi:MAG: hypothetical protein LBD11_01975 [Candidatus Peribacteria bacterium]|jgi:hypothetical protein|nr:hypothetical protein [Candidatus Peribacteria bacterium]
MIIIGYKTLVLFALANFSNGEEQSEMEMQGAKRRNQYLFLTIFRLPILPLWWKKGVWKVGDELYERPVSLLGKVVNQLFTLFGFAVLGLIFAIIMVIIGNLS